MTREKTPWQRRASAADLRQQTLVTLTGHGKTTVSRQLRGYWEGGVPKHVQTVIVAWELMSEKQRAAWLNWASSDRTAEEGEDELSAIETQTTEKTCDFDQKTDG
jgi:hypothetical protein